MPRSTPPEVVDDVFRYTTKAGHLIEIDLDIPAEVFKKSMADEAVTEEQQFAPVKTWLPKKTQDAFEQMGGLERARFFRTFFTAFQSAAAMPLGESFSSSTTSGSTETS